MSPKETTKDEGHGHGDKFDSIHRPSGGNGCGRGIISDFKNTVGTYWLKEMTNPNQKTLAVSFFLFFACIAPAISFGAIYAKATNNYIGPVEMILATAWCGMLYAIIGGQPMMINGGTGPVLAFTEILYKMSKGIGVPFLTFNAWIGFWVAFYLLLAAFFDLNRVIVYATRFTDEIFSLLIAAIFIINALGSPKNPVGIFHYFNSKHASHEIHSDNPDYDYIAVAFFSLILCIGTVQLSFSFRKFKFSPFFPSQSWRNTITDFAVVISIIVFSCVAGVLDDRVPTEKLNVPKQLAPTFACCSAACDKSWPDDCMDQAEPFGSRPWLVDIFDLNGKTWIPFFAAIPAILAFILVFLDDGITWHLINHPAHKLTHGDAYNYDTIIIAVITAVNSILGLPWLVAATVRSLNHIHAMAEKDSSGKILSVQETRLTHLLIHTLCLAVIFALDVLKLIPVPVLYGVFLYMGLLSLGTNQFWGRIMMFFMQPSKYPVEAHTTYVEPSRMHLFTAIQLFFFVLLYVVKSLKTVSIAFPIIIALCIPVRLYLLPRIFTVEELVMLDSDDGTIKNFFEWKKGIDGDNVEKALIDAMDDGKGRGTSSGKSGRIRVKSPSCPPDLLFAPLHSRTIGYQPRIINGNNKTSMAGDLAAVTGVPVGVPADDIVEDEAMDKVNSLPGVVVGTRSTRRARAKTLSCPTPHMLFSEAERQISSNYFFG